MLCGYFNEFSNVKTPFYILYKTVGIVCTLLLVSFSWFHVLLLLLNFKFVSADIVYFVVDFLPNT